LSVFHLKLFIGNLSWVLLSLILRIKIHYDFSSEGSTGYLYKTALYDMRRALDK